MRFIGAVAGILLLAVNLPLQADMDEPFATRNMSPMVGVHGLPRARSADQAAAGTLSWHLQTDFANNFTDSIDGNEAIVIDGETHQASLLLRYGISETWEIGIDVPYIRHTGGSLDGFIEDWHDWFGLPNGGREDVPQDLLSFGHQRGGVTDLLIDDSVSGVGDVTVHVGYRLGSTESSAWSLRAGVKLATGDADDLTGSDATDVFASIHHDRATVFGSDKWRFSGSIGAIALGNGEVLESQQEDWAVFGSGTLTWRTWEKVSLKAQLDVHTAVYDSDVKELGDFSAQLVVGGTARLGEHLLLDISVAEDIITDTSPDVVLQIGLRSTF